QSHLQPCADGRSLRNAGQVGAQEIRILCTTPTGSRETRRQAERPDHRGDSVSALSRLFQAKGFDRPGERQLEFRDLPAPPSRRRGGADCTVVGLDRLGPRGGWWGGPPGAALGAALADPSRRTILFTGEGSHQLTATAVGTMGRYGLKPIIFVLNNGGYRVERAREREPNWD